MLILIKQNSSIGTTVSEIKMNTNPIFINGTPKIGFKNDSNNEVEVWFDIESDQDVLIKYKYYGEDKSLPLITKGYKKFHKFFDRAGHGQVMKMSIGIFNRDGDYKWEDLTVNIP